MYRISERTKEKNWNNDIDEEIENHIWFDLDKNRH